MLPDVGSVDYGFFISVSVKLKDSPALIVLVEPN